MTHRELIVESMTSEEIKNFIQQEIAKGFEMLKDAIVPPEKPFLTIDEFAAKWDISRPTVNKWAKQGYIEYHEIDGVKRIANKPPMLNKKQIN